MKIVACIVSWLLQYLCENIINFCFTCDAIIFNISQDANKSNINTKHYIALLVSVTKKLSEILKLTVLSYVHLGEGVQTQSSILHVKKKI